MVEHRIRDGFTLVELAIVLVIIGLLVGGVLTGQDLIHAATMRAQVRQFNQYDEGLATFQVRYNCLPGDCVNASQFWPSLANGNGNGLIENNLATYYDASGSVTWTASTEYQNFFLELAQAGYLSGNFTTAPTVGGNLPALKYNGKDSFFASDTRSFQVLNPGVSRNPDITSYRHGNNALWAVACQVSGTSVWQWDDDCAIFLGIDLSSMDEKMDDGQPFTGKFIGFGGANSTNNCLSGSAYDLTQTTPQCQAAYILN